MATDAKNRDAKLRRGPTGKFLPKSYRGSYASGGKYFNASGKEISKDRFVANFKKSARKSPQLKKHVKQRQFPRARKRHKFRPQGSPRAYRGRDFDLASAKASAFYIVFLDVITYDVNYMGNRHEPKTITRIVGQFRGDVIIAAEFGENNECARRMTEEWERALSRGEEPIGFWRTPKPTLDRERRK